MENFPSVLETIGDLNKKQVEYLLQSARRLKKGDVPVGPSQWKKAIRPIIATSFLETSTRTKHSFSIAIQKLEAMYIDFVAEASSMKKGEDLEQTLLTLKHQGVNLCVIRTSISGELSRFKKHPPLKIVNAGDGTHQHPTQALLDLFTMKEIGFEPEGKTIAIIGDCLHSRVGHSLMELMPMFGARIILCAPSIWLPKDLPHPSITTTQNLNHAMEQADLLYLLRIQKERHDTRNISSYQDYSSLYGMSLDKIRKKGRFVPVFHPGPANIGVEIDESLIKSELYMGYQQVFCSVYMRMAVIKAMMLTG